MATSKEEKKNTIEKDKPSVTTKLHVQVQDPLGETVFAEAQYHQTPASR